MSHGELKIGVAGESTRRAALALVLRSLPADQRGPLVESIGRLKAEPLGAFDALVVVTDGAKVLAAAWAQPQPGRTASLWLPEIVEGLRPERVVAPLITLAMQRADAAGVQLSQVLTESQSDPMVPDLHESGFRRLTDLHYLEWLVTPSKDVGGAAGIGETAPVDLTDRGRLEAIVGQTYQDTLDCPELDGMRSIPDVLAGYQQTGDFDPELWFVLRRNGADAGVLLLNEHQASRQIELTYMGVGPAHRGHGLGRQAVALAQRVSQSRQAERLVLAVDDRNSPARDIYRAAGFKPWATRTVFIRPAPRA